MSDALFICDAQGHLTNFNAAFVTFHRFRSIGESKATVREYLPIIEVCTPDRHILPLEGWPVSRALRGETATNVEYFLRRKDINECWFGSYSFAPIRDRKDRIIGAVATARDITHTKKIEEDLRNISSRLSLALTSAHLGVWDWDVRTGHVQWDDRLLELSGITREQFKGTFDDWRNSLHPDDRNRALDEIGAALRGERQFDTEFRVIRPDGTTIHVKGNGVVLRASDGTPERMLGIDADITAQKNAEIDLKRAYAEVEAKVIERTAALEAAKSTAEQANRTKDLFLATLSHELRSPLSAILSWSQLMERGGLSPEKMALGIRTIKENVWAQNQLVSDLLDISRITTGKLMLDIQTINVFETITAAIETIRLSAQDRGISIIENLNGTDLYVNADPGRLKQALLNLLSNAIKFTPRGGSVFVSVSCQDYGRDKKLAIEIRDTGRGIKADFLPHLFDTFSQADASSIRVHGGMGLGLSLVKSLIELQGGTVRGDSPGQDKGATFTISLPLVTMTERDASRPFTPISLQSSYPLTDLRTVKILLVEDGDKTREALEHLLESHGAEVHSAASAQEAMAALEVAKPDIIVSDIAMPFEDGHSLLRRIRSKKEDVASKVPAIALTAFAEPKDRAEAFASGFQEYLAKPVDETMLVSTITRLVPKVAPV
jgi:PAS domain S-box-containing protein